MSEWNGLPEHVVQTVNANPSPAAVVLGAQVSGLSVARSLGRRGVPVVAVDADPRAPASASRFVLGLCLAPDPLDDGDTCVQRLITLGRQLRRRAALFPTSDAWALLIAQHAGRLASTFVLPPATYDQLTAILDKGALYSAAQAFGVPVPAFADLRTVTLHEAVERVGFPCALKPALKADFVRRFGQAALVARTWEQLAALTARLEGYPLILQRFVDAKDVGLHTVAVFVDRRHMACGIFAAHRLAVYPLEFGTSCLVQSSTDPDLTSLATRLLRGLRYAGVAEVEFLSDPADQRWKLIDINPRFWKWVGLPVSAGVDFVWLAYADWCGQSAQGGSQRLGVRWTSLLDLAALAGSTGTSMLAPEEWDAVLRGDGDGSIVDGTYDRDDPLPFVRFLENAMAQRQYACAC